MYIKIRDPRIVIYNGETNELIGEAKFTLSSKAEKDLLDLVNYNISPSSLILLDVYLYDPAKNYVPPTPFKPYKRKGILRALFKDSTSGTEVPIEIRFQYDATARGNLSGNLYYFDSIIFSNIKVESIEQVYY